MGTVIESSRGIIERAVAEIKPYAIVAMISGGKDSLAAYLVAKELGVKVTHILHGRTGTGIQETTEFVREFAAGEPVTYIEADAGDSYVDYVQRKGFFGKGVQAHSYAYHMLKRMHFRRTISRHIRQRRRNRPIVLINGARQSESLNRSKNMLTPTRKDDNNTWVNICHHWNQSHRDAYLNEMGAPVNPVTTKLCRSGECLCGSSQSQGARAEAAFYYPAWGAWLDELERSVKAKFGWGWGEQIPGWVAQEKAGQLGLFEPMCVGCAAEMEAQAQV